VGPTPPITGRAVRLALVAFGVLALLAVVAFATRSGFGGRSDAAPSATYTNYAFSAFLVVFVLAIPITIYAFAIQAREVTSERRSFVSTVVRNLLTLLMIMGIVAGVLYLRHHSAHFPHVQLPDNKRAKKKGGSGKDAVDYQPAFQEPVLWIALAILVPLAVVAVVANRRRLARRQAMLLQPLDAETIADELTREISDAIDDLRAEPDARAAVIAAYARMEGVLARRGLGRRASETPIEYLGRVLLELDVRADAVRRLTDLFQRAKFSSHAIDAEMKVVAIDALREIRDDLGGAKR